MTSILNSMRRALADYSLRKFVLYAVVPSHWTQLFALRDRSQLQVLDFSRQISTWLKIEATSSSQPSLVFRPWLKEAIRRELPEGQDCGVPPQQGSSDPEITLSHDRLGWMLQMAIYDSERCWQAVGAWVAARWQPCIGHRDAYSISERLSNLVLMWNFKAPPDPSVEELLRLMERDADHLLAHLEYHGDSKTNNHVLNNARALILFGAFIGNAKFYESGCWLFERELPKHVLADGVLREASAHYQWVVARWVVEVGCAFHAKDRARFLVLQPMLEKMLDVCEAMKLGRSGRGYLPLIGDISPDFPPALYGGLTGLGYALIGYENEVLSGGQANAGLWARLFVGGSKRGNSDAWTSSDKSWARATMGKWSMLAHADRQPHDNRSTHGHHDLFSFELAFDGVPLVVDPGRRDYLAARDSEEAGILEEWHNTILVDQCRTGFVPRGYMPTTWLEKWRSCPELEADEKGLAIRLVAPGEVPGVSRIERTIRCSDTNQLVIANQICKTQRRRIHVLLVLYVMGKVSQADGSLELELEGQQFTLRWSGLDRPLIRAALRYVSYGCAEPCTRLEWRIDIEAAVWESAIMISPVVNR